MDPQNGRIYLIRQGMTEYPKMKEMEIAMEIIKLFKSNSRIKRGIGDHC